MLAKVWVMSAALSPHGFWGPYLTGLWAQALPVFHSELVAGDSLEAGQLTDSGFVRLRCFAASAPDLGPGPCRQPHCLLLRLPLASPRVSEPPRAWGGCRGPGGLLRQLRALGTLVLTLVLPAVCCVAAGKSLCLLCLFPRTGEMKALDWNISAVSMLCSFGQASAPPCALVSPTL